MVYYTTSPVLDASDTTVSETGKVPGAHILEGEPHKVMCDYAMAEYGTEDGAESGGGKGRDFTIERSKRASLMR